jgi:endonuclease YncB( thermonuclease family)
MNMFLRIPWLVPLLIVLIGAAVLFFLQPSVQQEVTPTPNAIPTINKKAKGFLALKGAFVIIGKSPDGDSVRFKPENQNLLFQLKNPSRIKVSADGSVQLRFEGIDAPELHYGSLEQPLGAKSRDVLLREMGFSNVQLENRLVRSSTPKEIRGVILSQAAEGNGRPISYVIVGAFANVFEDGSRVEVTDTILEKTLNTTMLQNGMAYYTVYSSTPPNQRDYLKGISVKARVAKRGVWAVDRSAGFVLQKQADIDVGGQLILPKFFRRASDYLDAKRKKEFQGNLKAWLEWTKTNGKSENDMVKIGETEKRLSEWLEVRGGNVGFTGDLLEAVFVEK